jgi:hypothetical protein
MRDLTKKEMELVSGGLSVGDVAVLSGNGIGSGNHVTVSDILNGNCIGNGSLNGSANGTGIGNYSFND